jgi:hypothetical protein
LITAWRLIEFNRSEAQQLRQLMQSLVTGDRQHVTLENEIWVEPVAGGSLDLRVGKRNDGVRQEQPLLFACVLTREGWSNVEGLLEPFSESDSPGFQWLTTNGGAHLLISVNGQW